jgi:DNA-binding NtrC family response regulator
MPSVRLTEEAAQLLMGYSWPGNVRQLKNVAEQISIIEKEREIGPEILRHYLPDGGKANLPAVRTVTPESSGGADFSERELMYKVLFDMKRDINDLKKIVLELVDQGGEMHHTVAETHAQTLRRLHQDIEPVSTSTFNTTPEVQIHRPGDQNYHAHEEMEESLSLGEREMELIKKALEKHRGKRKAAADELGISERTLYRKIKEYKFG